MNNKLYFKTTSSILPDKNNNADIKRFIGRINYESMSIMDNCTIKDYCKQLKLMIKNHIDIEEYEIAAGLKMTLEQLES